MSIPPKTHPTGSPTEIHHPADRIALRRRAEIRGHHIGARRDAPDEHGLAEIAALLGQSALRGDVEQAAEPEGGVEDDAAYGDAGGVKAALKDVIGEDARLFQIRVQILESVAKHPAPT